MSVARTALAAGLLAITGLATTTSGQSTPSDIAAPAWDAALRSLMAVPTGAAGDECADCIPYTGTVSGTTVDNTGSTGDDTTCGSGDTIDEWYSYIAPCSGTATASLCGSGLDTTLAAFSSCGGLELACNDDFCSTQSQVDFCVTAGVEYKIRIAGWAGGTGNFTLDITCAASAAHPVNNRCEDRITILDNVSTAYDLTDACPSEPPFSCDPFFYRDVWFNYEAPCDGTVTIEDSSFNIVEAWSGTTCPPSGLPLSCNVPGIGIENVNAGDLIKIRVGAWDANIGELLVVCTPDQIGACCLPGDTCSDLVEFRCEEAGGVYLGDGVSCPPSCVAACCFPDGSCDDTLDAVACHAIGGRFQGPVTTCAAVTCDPFPANDNCAFRLLIPDPPDVGLPVDVTYDLSGATLDGTARCGLQGVNDIWFNYVAPCAGSVTIDATDSGSGAVVEAYSGFACPPTDLIDCGDEPGALAGLPLVIDEVNAGDLIKIRVTSWLTPGTETGTLTVTCTPASTGACCLPGDPCAVLADFRCLEGGGAYYGDGSMCDEVLCNDECDDRATIGDGETPFNLAGATLDLIDTCAGPPQGLLINDLWYNYVASCSGDLTVTAAANTAIFLEAYAGTGCPPTVRIDCNVNELTVDVDAGELIKIRLGPLVPAGATGLETGTLTVSCTNGACCMPDDTCAILGTLACAEAGGIYLGDDALCPPSCAGACCFPDGSCDDVLQSLCQSSGGRHTPTAACEDVVCSAFPLNDLCAFRELLPSEPDLVIPFDMSGATLDPIDFALRCADPYVNDIWYNYVAPCAGTVTFTATNSGGTAAVEVFAGFSCPPTERLACGFEAGSFSSIENVNAGDELKFRVTQWPSGVGNETGTLFITCTPAPTGACCLPDDTCDVLVQFRCDEAGGTYIGDGSTCAEGLFCVNDDCRDRLVIGDGVTPFDTAGATQDGSDAPCGSGLDGADLWFNYVATADGLARISADSPNTLIEVFGTTDCLPDDDRLNCQRGDAPGVVVPVLEGDGLKIRLAAWNAGATSGNLTIVCEPGTPPDCLDRSSVVVDETPYLITGARSELGIPPFSCDDSDDGSADVWFDYIASCTGILLIDANQTTGGQRAIVEAYAGFQCPPTDSLACGREQLDDLPLAIPVNVGDPIKIRVGSWNQGPGNEGILSISCEPAEACCLPAQPCVITAASVCTAAGGTPQGPGTNCATADCPLLGACCQVDGQCTIESEADCTAGGGTYQGDEVLCADLPTACNDECVTRAEILDGVPTPYSFQSATINPDDPPFTCDDEANVDLWFNYRAVCDGTLTVSSTNDSIQLWSGFSCPPTDELACVTGSSGSVSISVHSGDEIKIRIGSWGSGDPDILTATCTPAAVGACCFADLSCIELPATRCAVVGGVFEGNPSCDAASCPIQPVGACCQPGDICVEDTAAVCGSLGGTYQGDGTSCTPSPCNDECENRILVLDGDTPFDVTGATLDPEIPSFNCSGDHQGDLWFNYVASCDGTLTIDADATSNGAIVEAWSGFACPPTEFIGCGLSNTCCPQLPIVLPVLAGDEVKIRVAAWNSSTPAVTGTLSITCAPDSVGACCFSDLSCDERTQAHCNADLGQYQGDGTLCGDVTCEPFPEGACCFPSDGSCDEINEPDCVAAGGVYEGDGLLCEDLFCPLAPLNDDCEDRTLITDGVTPYDTLGATKDGRGDCQSDQGPDIWFNYIAALDGTAYFTVENSVTGDMVLQIYDSLDCPAGNEIECESINSGEIDSKAVPVVAGQELKIRVSAWRDDSANGNLIVECAPPPVNDDCDDRVQILDGITPISLAGATFDPEAPEWSCGEDGADLGGEDEFPDVWFNYTATCIGTLVIDFLDKGGKGKGSGCPPVFEAWRGFSCPPTDLIDCDEVNLSIPVEAGDEIKIRVGCWDTDEPLAGDLDIRCVPDPVGACCFFDSSCLDLTGFNCVQQGGLYQGDGFLCSEIECPTVGACCLNNGQCTIATIADCEAEGGVHEGDGVACASAACAQPSACCLGNGTSGDTCVYLLADRCEAAGGVFRGDGVLCEDGICFGSCCFAGGVCDLLDATECEAAGGLFQDRPSCDPNPCPQDFGACCFTDGSCSLMIGILCLDAGGTFSGAGSVCVPNDCPQPPDNDNCDGRIVIEAGATEFDLFLATFDEDADPWSCVAEANDIWFNYVVTCNGSVRIFVTEAGGDVVLEVYSIDTLGECPPTELIACEGITDTITVENVNVGDILKIRVGGILDAQFTGTLNIECIDGEIGACCFNDGSCEELVDHRCDEAGGDFVAGDCTPNDCPPATGACCFADGDCTVGTAPDCDTAGGEYSGNRTDCAPNDCPQPGACCFDDGSCDETLFEGACDAAGGDFQGDNTTCLDLAGAENCPQPGACCFDDGSCADLQETACDTAGGDFEGEDTACGPAGGVVCPQPGSCCFDDGSCEVILATACATGGGAFGGEDTSCTPNPCDGACCFDDGSCDVLNVDECAAGGGSYTVFDTGCDPNLCPQPTGACCFDDGDCELLTDDGCGVAGGDYSGDNTACVPNDCPQPTGACCFADTGACSILDAGACDTAGGTYSGDDTVCVPNDCPQPTGACCFDDGTCTDVTDEDCGVAGGDFQGDNTICNPCPQLEGACCFSNGSCTIDTAGGCVLAGGLYSGDDTVCVPNDCTQPTGACCFASGICTIDTLGDCSAAGGLYSGDDTGCAPNDCPQPPGACCLDDQSCLDVTEEDCDVAGGLFQGDGTACDPFSCTAVTRLQLDAASCVQTGSQFKVTLSMFDLLGFEAAGFQGFLEFDTTKLTLVSGAYTAAPFPIDLIPIDAAYIAAANVGPTAGLLDVASGIDFFAGVPTTEDAELVSFVFETMDIDECAATAAIGFRDHKPPSRITNLLGDAADALLVGAPDLTIDGTTPDLTLPADLTLNCTADTEPPASGTATATDNCDDDVSVSHVDAIVAGGCAQSFTIERTWTATDECGNETSGLQTIFVTDLRPPVILEIPPNRSVPCDAIPDPQLTLAASDTCDESVTEATYDGQTDSGDCTDRVITRSWTVMDMCGNSATTVQLLFVIDSNGPIIDAPADITVACGGAPDPGPVPASDACDEDVTEAMFVDDDETVNGCTTTIVRTWSAMDACGNTTTATQTITEIDTDGPVVADAPADVTVECDAIPAPRPTLAASDACDDTVTEATLNAPEIIPGTCSGEFTMIRSWTAMDTCGNSTTVTQTLTIFDDTAPVVADAPADLTLECDEDLPVPPASLDASDNCDESVTEAPFDGGEIKPGSCEGEFTMVRTWTATDDCGNSTTVMQTIHLVDTQDPILTLPDDIETIASAGGCSAAPDVGEATATDNCSEASVEGVRSDGEDLDAPYTGLTIITWTATDACGNSTSADQEVNVLELNRLVLDVSLQQNVEADLVRCIQFELVGCGGETTAFEQLVTFVDGTAAGVELLVPCGAYECIRARDPLHTLWSSVDLDVVDDDYGAAFMGADELLGGELNGDGVVDILDFTIFNMQFFTSPGLTDCDSIGPNADSSGNGTVGLEDFTFIQINFFRMDDQCCEGQTSASPVVDITTDELWRLGLGHHTVADLNGDGRVNHLDVALFASGVRPSRLAVFNGADGGSWFDRQNWAGGQPDHETDVAFDGSVKIDRTGAEARHVTVRRDGTLRLTGGALTARSLTIHDGATLRLEGDSVLAIESLTLEAGATLVWNGGTLEVAGGVFTQADFDLVIGSAPLSSTMRLTEGGVATIGRDTFIGLHAGDLGILEVVNSTFATGRTLSVGTSGAGWLVMGEDGLASAQTIEVGAAGHVVGDGRIEGDVTNAGVIAPNGVLTVDGALTQAAPGELAFQLTADGHDQLALTGDITLAGTLRIIVAEGYLPEVGAMFDLVVTDRSVIDGFDRVVATTIEGRGFEVRYEAGQVTLEVVGPRPGVEAGQ